MRIAREKTQEIQMLLKRLSEWGTALDAEEDALKKEIAELERSAASARKQQLPPRPPPHSE